MRLSAISERTFSVVRSIGPGILAGIIAGVIVGGLGSRIAMRVVALVAGAPARGLLTENGSRVGDITVAGSAELVVLAGVFAGLTGGLLFAAVKPWLSGFGRWRGLAFGLFLLTSLGYALIPSSNPDFRGFGIPGVNVALFASLFVLFGLAVAPLERLITQGVAPSGPGRASRSWSMVLRGAVWLAALLGLLFIVSTSFTLVAALRGVQDGIATGTFALCYTLVTALTMRLLLARGGRRFDRPADLAGRGVAALASYAVLGVPTVGGGLLTARSIGDILR